MKKVVSIIVVLLILAPFTAWGSVELSGTYVNLKNKSVYLVFSGDTFTWHMQNRRKENVAVSGTYKVYRNLASETWPYYLELYVDKSGRQEEVTLQISANKQYVFDYQNVYEKR